MRRVSKGGQGRAKVGKGENLDGSLLGYLHVTVRYHRHQFATQYVVLRVSTWPVSRDA